jgi:hypothetical protein
VEAEGRLIGNALAWTIKLAMPTSVWEIGLERWDEADRGHGLGRLVQLLIRDLFESEAAIRIQATRT